jgi:hypothetical protein
MYRRLPAPMVHMYQHTDPQKHQEKPSVDQRLAILRLIKEYEKTKKMSN